MSIPFVSTTVREVPFKNPINGFASIPVGTEVSVTWNGIRPVASIPTIRDEPLNLSNKGIALMFGFNVPNMAQLEEWHNEDGGCESILGNWVEPDGYDEHGAPSWMLSLCLI